MKGSAAKLPASRHGQLAVSGDCSRINANHSPWTAEEDAYLLREWVKPETRGRAIAQHLGRSPDAVTARAAQVLKLGVKPKFSNAELAARDAMLAKIWNTPLKAQEIADQLNMPRNSVISLARRLKLPSKKPLPKPRLRKGATPAAPLWTSAAEVQLRRLFAEGLSYGEIAKRLGVSRSAVSGKVDRLDLPPRGPTARNFNQHRAKRSAPLAGPNVQLVQPHRPGKTHAPRPGSVVLAMLAAHQCKWPVGDDPGRGNGDRQLFCADPTDDGATYCADHDRSACQGKRTPEQRAADEARTANMRAAKGCKPNQNTAFFASRGGRAA